MKRLIGRLCKSVALSKYFFKVPLVGCFMPLVGGIGQLVESPLYAWQHDPVRLVECFIITFAYVHFFYIFFYITEHTQVTPGLPMLQSSRM